MLAVFELQFNIPSACFFCFLDTVEASVKLKCDETEIDEM